MASSGSSSSKPDWQPWHQPATPAEQLADNAGRADALRARLGQIEDRHSAILAALHEGVIVQDSAGVVETTNASAERILGLTADQIARRSPRPASFRILREDGSPFPDDEQPAAVALRTGEPQFDVVMGITRSDGSLAWLSVNAQPFIDSTTGRPAGVVSSFFDITLMKQEHADLKTRADELSAVGDRLRSSNSELEAFSYTVSHDLRAPFRHIAGFSEILLDQESARLSAKGQEYLHTIADSAVNAGKLVDALLTFAHLGRSAMKLGPVDMNELVRDIRAELAGDIGDRSVTWRIGTLPPVHADERMMRMVWRNLLSNAVKYTRKRPEAVIQVGCRSDDKELVFFVKDNGAGFDMQYAGKLFGVFERLHDQEEFEGTGIGLAHVRRILSRHGGRTWAEAQPDHGATFFFSLPVAAGPTGR